MSEVSSGPSHPGSLTSQLTDRVILKLHLSAPTCPTVGMTSLPYTIPASDYKNCQGNKYHKDKDQETLASLILLH